MTNERMLNLYSITSMILKIKLIRTTERRSYIDCPFLIALFETKNNLKHKTQNKNKKRIGKIRIKSIVSFM